MQSSILLDKIPLGIMIFDESIQIISTNMTSEIVIEKTKDCLVDIIKRLVLKTLDKNGSVEKTIKYINLDDFYVWKIKTEQIKYSSPQVLVVIQDITLFYQLEQTVLKAEKLAVLAQIALGSLLEIRNPLTSAIGFCQFIEQHAEIKMEYIKIISDELEEIQNILENNTSMIETSPSINLEIIYKKIWAYLSSQVDSFRLILVTDDFDHLAINIAEKHVNTVTARLINVLDIWMQENVNITIDVELHEARYLNLNIQANFALKPDLDRNPEDMIENLEGRNKQIELRLINDNAIALNFHLPIIIPHSTPKSESKNTEVLLDKGFNGDGSW